MELQKRVIIIIFNLWWIGLFMSGLKMAAVSLNTITMATLKSGSNTGRTALRSVIVLVGGM